MRQTKTDWLEELVLQREAAGSTNFLSQKVRAGLQRLLRFTNCQ